VNLKLATDCVLHLNSCCRPPGANPTPYDYTPYFYSREFSLSWQFYGTSEGADAVITWGDATPAAAAAAAGGGDQAPKFGAYWVKGGAVVGAFVEGAGGEEGTALKAVVRARAAAPSAAVLGSEGVAWAVAASSKL
jgi:monodehydroascorbate reductase (NADH)